MLPSKMKVGLTLAGPPCIPVLHITKCAGHCCVSFRVKLVHLCTEMFATDEAANTLTSAGVKHNHIACRTAFEMQQVLGVADTRLGVWDGLVTWPGHVVCVPEVVCVVERARCRCRWICSHDITQVTLMCVDTVLTSDLTAINTATVRNAHPADCIEHSRKVLTLSSVARYAKLVFYEVFVLRFTDRPIVRAGLTIRGPHTNVRWGGGPFLIREARIFLSVAVHFFPQKSWRPFLVVVYV